MSDPDDSLNPGQKNFDQLQGAHSGQPQSTAKSLADAEQTAAQATPTAGEPGDKRPQGQREAEANPIPYSGGTAEAPKPKKNGLKIAIITASIVGIIGGVSGFYGALTSLPRTLVERAAHATRQRISGYGRERIKPYLIAFLSKSIFGNTVAINNCANDKDPAPIITKECFYRTRKEHPNNPFGRVRQAWWDSRAIKRMVASGTTIMYVPASPGKPARWAMQLPNTKQFEVSIENPEVELETILKTAETQGDVYEVQRAFMEKWESTTNANKVDRILMRRYWKKQFGLSGCNIFCYGKKRPLAQQSKIDAVKSRLLGVMATKIAGSNVYGLTWGCMLSRDYACSDADSEFRQQYAEVIKKARERGVEVATIENAIKIGDEAKNANQGLAQVLTRKVLERIIGKTATSIILSPVPVVGQVIALGTGLLLAYTIYDFLSSEQGQFVATLVKDEAYIGAANFVAVLADEKNANKSIYDGAIDSATQQIFHGSDNSLVTQSLYGNVQGLKDYQALFNRPAHAATLGPNEYPNLCNDRGEKRYDNELVCRSWRYDYKPPVLATAQKVGLPHGNTNEIADIVADIGNEIVSAINTPSDAASEAVLNTDAGRAAAEEIGKATGPLIKDVTEQLLSPPFDNPQDIGGAKLVDAAWAGTERSLNLRVKGGIEDDDTPYGWGRVLTQAEAEKQTLQAYKEIDQKFASLPLLDRLMSPDYSQSFVSQFAYSAPTAINSPFQFAASVFSPITGMRFAALNSPSAKAAINPASNFFRIPFYGADYGPTELGAPPAIDENFEGPCPNDRAPISMNDPAAVDRGLGQAETTKVNICALDLYALKLYSGQDDPEPIDETATEAATSPVGGQAGSGVVTGTLAWPIEESDYKKDSSCFGDPRDGGSRKHAGVDLIGKAGDGITLIRAADGGVVEYVNPNSPKAGGRVVIRHGANKYTMYHHMWPDIRVKKGDLVGKGQVIGRMGNFGLGSTGAHLHFSFGSSVDESFSTSVNPLSHLQPWSGAYQSNTSCPR